MGSALSPELPMHTSTNPARALNGPEVSTTCKPHDCAASCQVCNRLWLPRLPNQIIAPPYRRMRAAVHMPGRLIAAAERKPPGRIGGERQLARLALSQRQLARLALRQ